MTGVFLGGVCLIVIGLIGGRMGPEIGRYRRLLIALGVVLVVVSAVPALARRFREGYETGRRIRQQQTATGAGSTAPSTAKNPGK